MCMFFFFKQKTAYEMRISDWSSDVCSSDLTHAPVVAHVLAGARLDGGPEGRGQRAVETERTGAGVPVRQDVAHDPGSARIDHLAHGALGGAGQEFGPRIAAQVGERAIRLGPRQQSDVGAAKRQAVEIGRASCRERVCPYVSISGVA